MSHRGKAFFSLLALFLLLAVPFMAFAASYSSTLHFDSNLTGASRSYAAGSISVKVNSPTATWTNMIAGNYYFYFTKAIDGMWIDSNDVDMYN